MGILYTPDVIKFGKKKKASLKQLYFHNRENSVSRLTPGLVICESNHVKTEKSTTGHSYPLVGPDFDIFFIPLDVINFLNSGVSLFNGIFHYYMYNVAHYYNMALFPDQSGANPIILCEGADIPDY